MWEAKVAEQYNVDEIKARIINGDGDPWIKPDSGWDNIHFQLDPFHISREVLRKVPDKKQAGRLNKLLRAGKIEESFKYLTGLLIEYTNDEDEFKKLEKFTSVQQMVFKSIDKPYYPIFSLFTLNLDMKIASNLWFNIIKHNHITKGATDYE